MSGREPLEISLSPPDAGSAEVVQDRSADPQRPERTITNVTSATLTVSWPRKMNHPVPCVLICPGGGYGMLVIDKEGHDLARWFNANGLAAAVLKYRLPEKESPRPEEPLPVVDARRALRVLRLHAAEWNIRPGAVGIMGSSAGGHLAATMANHFDHGNPEAEDPLGRQSSRPDFQILLYPVISFDSPWLHAGSRRNLIGADAEEALRKKFSAEKQVTRGTPPAFVVHAVDDGITSVEHSRHYAAALQAAGVPCEYLELATGGHGFGLGVRGGEPLQWPPLCLRWLHQILQAEP